ncbi:mechanosensitive ion channel family protein [Methylomagnum sp.]
MRRDEGRRAEASIVQRSLKLLLALLLANAPHAAAARTESSPATLADIPLANVEIDGRVLFRVRGVSAFPAGARAESIENEIVALAQTPDFDPGQLRIQEGEYRTDILAGDRSVMTLYDADGTLEQAPRQKLADAKLERLRVAIADYRRDRSPEYLRRAAEQSLAAGLAVAAALWLLLRLNRGLGVWMDRRLKQHIQSVGIQSFEFLRAERIFGALRASLSLAAGLVGALLLAFGLHYVLVLFPWTRHSGEALFAVLANPFRVLGGELLDKLPDLVFLSILFVLVRHLLKILRFFFDSVAQGSVQLAGFQPEWAEPSYKIARLAALVFTLTVAYPHIPGSESDAFKGISLFLGLMFSLGSSSFLANTIAGYSLIYRRAFKLGDRVKIGEAFGDVIEMRLQVTHLRSLKNEEIIVPNSTILTSEVVNYSSLARREGLILHTTVGIGYEVPWRQVEAMLVLAAERTHGLLNHPPPFVLQRSLGDFAVNYELNAHCGEPSRMMPLYTELHRNILDVFNEYGVQIMTPNYQSDPADLKLVPKEQWHAAPAAAKAGTGEDEPSPPIVRAEWKRGDAV